MTGKKSISIKHFLRISLAVMLLFLFIIAECYTTLLFFQHARDSFQQKTSCISQQHLRLQPTLGLFENIPAHNH